MLRTSAGYISLSVWLSSNSNSNSIHTIEVQGTTFNSSCASSEPPWLHLPTRILSKLQVLKLQLRQLNIPVRHTARSYRTNVLIITETAPASLGTLTAVTRLQLTDCILDIRGLGSCTNLQHLQLSNFEHVAAACSTVEAATANTNVRGMLAAALPQLQHLTHITLQQGAWTSPILRLPQSFEGFGNLQQLKELRLQHGCYMTSPSSLVFPTSLTLLQLISPPDMTISTTPALTALSNLHHLNLQSCKQFDIVLLLSYPKLEYLRLDNTGFAGAAAAPAEDPVLGHFLSALVQLTQLQHLDLSDTLVTTLETAEPYAALTASSHLTYLCLYECMLHESAFDVMFTADRPCKGLLEVCANTHHLSVPGTFERLAVCCPALQVITPLGGGDASPEIDLQVGCCCLLGCLLSFCTHSVLLPAVVTHEQVSATTAAAAGHHSK